MNLKEKINSFLSKLGSWWKLQIIALLTIFSVVSGHTAVVPSGGYVYDGLGTLLNNNTESINLKVNNEPSYITNWLNMLKDSNNNCQTYISVLDHFNTCTPSNFQSDLITDRENENPFLRSPDAEQES